MVVAFLTWAWVLLAPTLTAAAGMDPTWLQHGPFGMHWLAPQGLFGLTGWSPLGRAVGASLFTAGGGSGGVWTARAGESCRILVGSAISCHRP